MSRIGVTYQEVADVIQQLQAQGKEPTVDRIRGVLGTGSNSTLSRYLREWKAEKAIPNAYTVPSELANTVKALWAQLQSNAEQRIEALQQETKQQIAAKATELTESQQKYAESLSHIHALKETLHQHQEEIHQLSQNLQASQLALSQLQGHASALEKQNNEQKAENNRLYTLLHHVQKNLEHYQQSVQQLQQEKALAIEKQTVAYEQTLTQLRQQLMFEVSEKEKFKSLLEQTQGLLEESKQAYTVIEERFKEKVISEATIHDRYHQLLEQFKISTSTLEHKSKLLVETEQKYKIENQQVLVFKQTLEQAQEKIERLRQEQLSLAQEKATLEGQLKQMQTFMQKQTSMA